MITLVASEKQRRFGRDKYETLPGYCRRVRRPLRLLRRVPAQSVRQDAASPAAAAARTG